MPPGRAMGRPRRPFAAWSRHISSTTAGAATTRWRRAISWRGRPTGAGLSARGCPHRRVSAGGGGVFFVPVLPGPPGPVAQPASWHHHGLNFSRAWGLWALYAASPLGDAREGYLKAYAAHFRATYDMPALWRGSYHGVGHWVPQFGMLALQPLFGM